ncbi:MAG: hypothetical protein II289_00245 [Bacteroidales bacterium]|nr:hypothetical protein [Bacteroidales bacterium]
MRKRWIAVTIVAIISVTIYYMFRPAKETASSGIAYKEIPALKGIAYITLGKTFQDIKNAIDSSYAANKQLLKENYIDKSEMFTYEKPTYGDIPDKYNKDYLEYEAVIVISDELISEKAHLFFWKDTLQRIWFSNSDPASRKIGEAMVWKYGEGEGFRHKTNSEERQLHLWGNDYCIARYQGSTTYSIGSSGLANGIDRWFHEVEIKLNDTGMERRISAYLQEADSLWKADAYGDI